jgi:PAS domain S-box-containing protein/putative nucleotidyltransferase with HDIG domain
MSGSVLLIVDDRPDNLFVLERLAGAYLPDIKVITAESAAAGLALAATEAIDGALIDMQMPGMNGIEMCRRLKADPRTAPTHVILVTGHLVTSALRAQGLAAGADDFINKPIDNVELAAKLRVMLRLRAAEQALRRERDHLEETVQERTRALREAEYRFRTLFNAVSAAIFFNDLKGRLLEVNDEACRLLGYSREELLRLNINDLVAPENTGRRPELLEQLRTAGHLMFETEHLSRDGRRIPVECSSRIIDFQGRPAVLSITRDISERKTAEEALSKNYRELQETAQHLEQSRNMLQLIIESVPVRVFWKDSDLRYMGCNTLFARDAGFSHPQQLLGKDDFAMGWREQADLYRIDDRQVMESRAPKMNIVEPQTTPVGARIWLSTSKVPLQMPNGGVFGVLGVYEDVTDRKLAEEALRKSEELYRSLFENMLNGFAYCKMLFDQDQPQDFIYLNVNNSFETLTGLKDVVGKRVSEVIPGMQESDPELLKIYGRVALTGKPEKFETFVEALQMWFSISVYSPEKEYFVAVFDVITERKEAEKKLRASEERYRSMVTNTMSAVALHEMLYDPEGRPCDYRFLTVNPAFEKLTGFSPEQVEGKTVLQVLPGLDPFWIETYGRVVATGAPVAFERYGENLKRYFRVMAYKTQDNQFTTIFSDITAVKESEANRLTAMTASLQSLATAIEMRDPYISGHQRRVTALAGAIARELGLDEERIKGIELGGILHDIGKISVPTEILSKPGKLSETEFAITKSHPESGYEILKNINGPWPLSQMVLQHHERLDGSGYPQGLKDDEIILEAKILAVADVVEAMASHRPYRPALGLDRALEEITRNKGTLYDPEVVDACIMLFSVKKFHFD